MSDAYTPRLGWLPFDERTAEQHEAHEEAVGLMPRFAVFGDGGPSADLKKIVLTDLWSHREVVAALGYEFPRVHQLTGSCVGAAGGNTIFTLSCVEVLRLGQPEQLLVPFWLYPYGVSRRLGGMRGRGEGSFGSTFARAVREYGCPRADFAGLPAFRNADGLVWTEEDELRWSDGAAAPAAVVEEARPRLVRTTSPCPTADAVREAIRNLYPCTAACSGYVGNARVRGTHPALVGEIDSRGGHQTSILGWWEHPELGELFAYQNQWPASVYPRDPGGLAACATWITKKTMQWICDQGEVYAFSQHDGYPAQKLSWLV